MTKQAINTNISTLWACFMPNKMMAITARKEFNHARHTKSGTNVHATIRIS